MSSLIFYDIENAAQITTLDLGTVAPSSSDDTMLRLFNPDDYNQAEDVTVAATDTQLWLSLDGESFGASIMVGDIPPGGSSPPFWLRRVTPSDAGVAGDVTVTATPASWTAPLDNTSSTNVFIDTAG